MNLLTITLFFMSSGLLGCRSDLSKEAESVEWPGMRERYLANSLRPEGPDQKREWKLISEAYFQATSERAQREGEARFVILDEAGKPVDDVDLEFRLTFHPGPFANPLEAAVQLEKRVASGTIIKKMPRSSLGLYVVASKKGHRPINFYLRGDRDKLNSADHYYFGEMLVRGHLLPPLTRDGPMRVILPPALVWEPSKFRDGEEDRVPHHPPRELWPKRLDRATAPVVTSEGIKIDRREAGVGAEGKPTLGGRSAAAPKRGTYALIDRDGTVLMMTQLDAGNFLSLAKSVDDAGTVTYSMSDPGSGSTLTPPNPPYQWQFYAEPRPRIDK